MKHERTVKLASSSEPLDVARFTVLASVLCLGVGVLAACGSSEDNGYSTLQSGNGADANAANGANGAGSGATGASAGDASGAASTTSGGIITQPTGGTAGSTTGGNPGDFEECAGTVSEGETLALDMFIVLDHTTSMTENEDDCPLMVGGTPGSNNKWCYATHALASFFVNNTAPGARAALNFMAMPGYICEGGPDNPQAQAQVPLTPLPTDPTGPLITALSDDGPFGVGDGSASTAIEAALRGMNDFTVANQTPGRKMIGILISDGDPSVCEQNVDNLAALVAEQLSTNGIETYFIGMTGATEQNLETMALQGGAPEHSTYCGSMASCHFWSVGDGDPAAFVDALNQIQTAALLPCSYQIPTAPAGEVINYGLVNAEFTTAAGEQIKMTKVENSAACQPGVYQWYYDNETSPNSLELCPDACQVATEQGDGASVKVAYGCATDIAVK